jgi:exosortase
VACRIDLLRHASKVEGKFSPMKGTKHLKRSNPAPPFMRFTANPPPRMPSAAFAFRPGSAHILRFVIPAPSTHQATAAPRRAPEWPGFALAIAAIALLLGAVPYTQGWGESWVSVARWTWAIWWEVEDSRHGLIVIPIAVALAHRKRAAFAEIPLHGTLHGLPWFVGGGVLFWIGRESGYAQPGYLAGMLWLAGSVHAFLGPHALRLLAFPLFFLVFGMPLGAIGEGFAFKLRWVMAGASADVLNGLGIATFRDGTALLSAGNPVTGVPSGDTFHLDVADPCSGIRSLTALVMLCALVAHLRLRSFTHQVILLAASIPLAVLGNMVRLVGVGIVAAWINPAFATGTFHDLAGFAVFLVALSGALGLVQLLQVDWQTLRASLQRPAPAPPAAAPGAGSPEARHASDRY